MSIKLCSEIKVKSNYTAIGKLPYNTIDLGGSEFHKRLVIYDDDDYEYAVFRIDSNGNILDSDGDSVALPCPKYCEATEDKEKGKIVQIPDPKLNTSIQPTLNYTGYSSASLQALGNQSNCSHFFELEVLISANISKTALIGLTPSGKMLDADYNLVAIK